MMKLIVYVLLVSLVGLVLAADRCEYSYCVNDELHVCENSKDRVECNNKGGLYVTYKRLPIPLLPSDHKCCIGWKIDQLSGKSLYCVRNIRDAKRKCTSDRSKNDENYTFRTACEGHAFLCL